MPQDYDPDKREFELALRKNAGGWAGKLSAEEDEELRRLQESKAMKRRTAQTEQS